MDFILFLIFAAVVFYFNQINPRQQQRAMAAAEERTPQRILRPTPVKMPPPSHTASLHQTMGRPRMPPLHGIEISAAQRRRLGKNDPSVIAAQLNKQLSNATQNTPSFLSQLKQQLEQATQQINNNSPSSSHTALPLAKQLNKLFEDLFSNHRPR